MSSDTDDLLPEYTFDYDKAKPNHFATEERTIVQSSFTKWFAKYLKQDSRDIESLLRHKSAVYFLMTWSIFETVCFGNYMKFSDVKGLPKKIVVSPNFDRTTFDKALSHFHRRYQDSKLYGNLIFESKNDDNDSKNILGKALSEITDTEAIHLITFVIYRYRNNIFHGNKGVSGWLNFTTEIDYCSDSMQKLIDVLKPNNIED